MSCLCFPHCYQTLLRIKYRVRNSTKIKYLSILFYIEGKANYWAICFEGGRRKHSRKAAFDLRVHERGK